MPGPPGSAPRQGHQATTVEERAAQGCFAVIRPGRRRVIKVMESLLRPAVRLWQRIKPTTAKKGSGVQHILVIEYSFLGDIVLALPFLRNLRLHFPDAHITLLVHPSVPKLLEGQGLADELITIRMPWVEHYSRLLKWNPFSKLYWGLARTMSQLRKGGFDLAFSVRGDIRDNFLLWCTRADRRVGYAFGGGAFLLTDVVPPDLDQPHISDRWLRFLEHIGKAPFERQPQLKLSPEERNVADRFLAENGIHSGDLIVGFHSKARLVTRQWSERKFDEVASQLVEKYGAKILWFQEPQPEGAVETPGKGIIPVRLPLRHFLAVLSRCNALVCNEGGPMHMAIALNVPTVAIFGSTEPSWYAPRAERDRVVIRPDFWCRPCGNRCLFDQPYCISTIPAEQVFHAAEQVIARFVQRERLSHS